MSGPARPVALGVLLALLLAVSAPASAQSLADPAPGVAGLGLGGAGVTTIRDATGLWSNPALIGRVTRPISIGLGLQTVDRSVRRTSVNPLPEARDAMGVQLVPSFALAVPLWRRRLWVGLGYHLALKIDSRYPLEVPSATAGAVSRDAPARYRGTELTLEQHVVSLGVAVRRRWIAAGAALELRHVRFRHRQSLWAGVEADHLEQRLEDPRLDVDAIIEGRETLGVGAIVGVWLQPHPWLELGLALQLPGSSAVRGVVTLTPGPRPPAGYASIAAHDGAVAVDLQLPLRLRGGVALGPPRARLILEAALARWSDEELTSRLRDTALVLGGAAPVTRPLSSLALGIRLREQLAIHAGVELVAWPGYLIVRTGYAFHRGATLPTAPSSTLLDLDRHVWALGLEVTCGWLRFGIAFAHSFEATLDAPGSAARLVNPLEPSVTGAVGQGSYSTSALQVLFEVQAGWR
jgi:hypothetical protein